MSSRDVLVEIVRTNPHERSYSTSSSMKLLPEGHSGYSEPYGFQEGRYIDKFNLHPKVKEMIYHLHKLRDIGSVRIDQHTVTVTLRGYQVPSDLVRIDKYVEDAIQSLLRWNESLKTSRT